MPVVCQAWYMCHKDERDMAQPFKGFEGVFTESIRVQCSSPLDLVKT